jgi:hypothetical protein
MVTAFTGSNGDGTQSSGLFPINATRDSLFGMNATPGFKLTGLNPEKVYSFTFYASRVGPADNRETQYTVTGATSGSAVLNPVNNVDGSVSVTGIEPDSSFEITIELSPTANNNNPDKFIYLGLLRVEAGPSDPDPVVIVSQPSTKNVHEFGTTNFSATVSGTLPFTIQWTKNGVAIPGANQLTYTIPLVTSDLNGAVYAITVTNAVSTETSNNATLTVIPAPTNPHRLLVDFGNNATQTLHGSSPDDPVYYWNNVTPTIGDTSSGQLANLVTDENVSTGTKISMVSRFNGANSNGTLTSSMYAVDVTRDSLVGNTETSGGLTNIFPSFRLSGLNPDWIYHLTFYASRTSVADNRTARYTVTGIISSFDELNASNNVDGTAVVPGMMPTAAGQLLITITHLDLAEEAPVERAQQRVGAVRLCELAGHAGNRGCRSDRCGRGPAPVVGPAP